MSMPIRTRNYEERIYLYEANFGVTNLFIIK